MIVRWSVCGGSLNRTSSLLKKFEVIICFYVLLLRITFGGKSGLVVHKIFAEKVIRVAYRLSANQFNNTWMYRELRKYQLFYLFFTNLRAVNNVASVSFLERNHPCRRTLCPIV